ncbi:MAG: hypothetical protein IT435_19120 [Phycisphaerales bacterium]|nr:hypothetical protein [Phycisphaerales bacterium]
MTHRHAREIQRGGSRTSSQRVLTRSTFPLALAARLVLVCVLATLGCERRTADQSDSARPPVATGPVATSDSMQRPQSGFLVSGASATEALVVPNVESSFRLSSKANEISGLLDSGNYDAALRLLLLDRSYIASDAGLRLQLARTVVIFCPVTGVHPIDLGEFSGVQSMEGRAYAAHLVEQWPLVVARNILADVVRADSSARSYSSDVVLRDLYSACDYALKNNGGIVGEVDKATAIMMMQGVGDKNCFEVTMLQVGWDAVRRSPEIGKKWALAYEGLAHDAAGRGYLASAMMLGKLSGDLYEEREGATGHHMSTEYFKLSMENSMRDDRKKEWARRCWEWYQVMFKTRIDEIPTLTGGDRGFEELSKAVRAFISR